MPINKFKFITNKKLLFYIAIIALVMSLSRFAEVETPSDLFGSVAYAVILLVGVIVILYFNSAKYYFEDGYITHDSLVGKSVKLSDITEIHIQQKSISLDYLEHGATKSLKIRGYLLDTNIDKARELVDGIVNGVSKETAIDDKILSYTKEESSNIFDKDYSKFGGSLIVLAILIGAFALYDFISIFPLLFALSIKFDYTYILYIVFNVISLIIGALAFVYLVSKEKRSILTMKIYFIFSIFISILDTIILLATKLASEGNLEFLMVFGRIISITHVIILALAIFEFLKTSISVKKTLVK